MRKMSQKERLDAMLDRPIPKKKVGIVHLEMVKESRRLYGTSRFRTPEEAAEMVMPMFERAHREMVLVMTMDSKLEIQAAEIAAVGGLNYCYIDMKEIFKLAILNNSAYIICVHNHPSGDVSPSLDDDKITKRMWNAGQILGIGLIDHIIVGESGYYSYKEEGRMPEEAEQSNEYKDGLMEKTPVRPSLLQLQKEDKNDSVNECR